MKVWLLAVLGAAIVAGCKKKEQEVVPEAPLPTTPPSASAPDATSVSRDVSLGLPRGCKLDGPATQHRLEGKAPLFFAADGNLDELVVANGTTRSASVYRKGERAGRPVAFFPDDRVPHFASADGVWLSATSWPSRGSDTRILLGRDAAIEVLATGDSADVADLRCDGRRCALLATRILRSRGAGATVLFGGPRVAKDAWTRVDVEPERASSLSPFTVARLDETGADVAMTEGTKVVFARVPDRAGERATPGKALEAPHGVLDALVLKVPIALAHGAAVVGDCGKPRSLLAVITPDETRVVPLEAAVTSMVSRRVGEYGLVVWVTPGSCGDPTRRVVYALSLSPEGVPLSAPMAVADAEGVAVAVDGDRVVFRLLRKGTLVTMAARCAFGGAVP